MFVNIDLPIFLVATCAAGMMVPYDFWSLSYLCTDVGLFFVAIGAYLLASKRITIPSFSSTKSCQGPCVTSISDKQCCFDHIDEDVASTLLDSKEAMSPELLEDPQFNVNEHVSLMEKYAAERNLGGTMRTFRLIQTNCQCLSSHMYNVVLQACVNCGNVQAAEDWMEETMEAKMADEVSFTILVKALVRAHDLSKAKDTLKDMKQAGLQTCVAAFDELLSGYVRERRFNESLSLLEQGYAWGVRGSSTTLKIIAKLITDSRNVDQKCARLGHILKKYNFPVSENEDATPGSAISVLLPRLAVVMSQAAVDDEKMLGPCVHEVNFSGSHAQIKAVRKTIKQNGFLDKDEIDAWPLDGHWETDYRLTVVVEGKMVRWSGQRASRLRFTSEDRSACVLTLYGEEVRGRLVGPPSAPDAKKMLVWENGDVWHSYDGRVIGQDVLFSQTMTKTRRDKVQDEASRQRSIEVLRCVSKQALGIPSILEEHITQFLGNDLYHVRVNFASKWNPSRVDDEDELPLFEADSDICGVISRRHPHVGLRHCWAERGARGCGQRTLINGTEVDEGSFGRHLGAVSWA